MARLSFQPVSLLFARVASLSSDSSDSSPRLSPLWRRLAALALVAGGLVITASASAIDTLPGARAARFTWAPSDGDVGGYEVRVSVNGGAWYAATRTKKTEIVLQMASEDRIQVAVAAYDVLGVLGPQSPVSQPVTFVPAALPPGRTSGPIFGLASRDIPLIGHWRTGARDGVGVAMAGSRGWVFVSMLGSTLNFVEYGDINIDQPIVGDWDGDGDTDPGVYREYQGRLVFHLQTDQGIRTQAFGDPAIDTPIVGDWNGDGIDDIGVTRSYGDDAKLVFHLSLPNQGIRTIALGQYGVDMPIAGDWNGDGIDDIGIARPYLGFNMAFHLRIGTQLRTELMVDAADGVPIVGDWNGDGYDDVGVALENAIGEWEYEYLVLDPAN